MPSARPTTWSWILACVLGASSILVAITLYSSRTTTDAMLTARRAADYRVALHAVLEDILDAETGQRGYVLTGNASYLAPYQAARARIGARLADAETALRTAGVDVTAALRPLVDAKLAELAKTVAAVDRGDNATALALVRNDRGQQVMTDIRRVIESTDAELEDIMEQRRAHAESRDRLTSVVVSAAALAIVAALAIGFVLRRAIQERTRANAERDAILDELPIAVGLVDARTGNTVYANPALAKLGTKAFADPIARALAGRRVAEQVTVDNDDGAARVLVNAVPLALPRPAALLALADITDLSRAQAQLDALFENVPIGLAFVDLELRYARVNQRMAALGARSPEDYIGKTVPEVFGEVGRAFLPTFESAKSGTPTLGIESEEVLPASPERRWYLSDFFPVRAPDGEILGVGASSTDITEIKRSIATTEATFDQAAVGIGHVGLDGRWQRVNQRLCDILGYTREQLLASKFQDITVPDDLPRDEQYVRELVAGERGSYTMEKRYIRRDSSPVWVLLSVSLVRHADGSPLRFISVVVDIDALKRAEADLAALNRELETRIAQRTDRLTELNAELEAFSYSVSHDLRAPLRAIGSYCQILAEEHSAGLDAEGKDALARTRAAAVRMGRLIDDMLELSRTTRAEIRHHRVDLSALAERTVAELREQSPLPNAAVTVQPGLEVVGDERLLSTALRNLLGNAWKFTAGSASPQIELRCENRDGERVYLISDNGAGFDMKYVSKLFAPFQRLHPQTAYEGTGIGLATVKRVIVKHGGRVWVDRASIGGGVTIAFTLGGQPS